MRALDLSGREDRRGDPPAADGAGDRVDFIGAVRGRGAMMAIELVEPGGRLPNPAAARAVVASALRAGVVVLSCGAYGNVIRLLPPLVISDELLEDGLSVLEDALREAAAVA